MNKKIKTVIVEDIFYKREVLVKFLNHFCSNDVEIIGVYDNLHDAMDKIEKLKPDLLFLDIDFGDEHIDGIDFLNQFIVEGRSFEVIIYSVYPEYAKDAFTFDVADYISTPLDGKRLVESINRVKKRLIMNTLTIDNYIEINGRKINYDNIMYLEADSGKVYIKIAKRKGFLEVTGYTLNKLETILPQVIQKKSSVFRRNSHSNIVNFLHIYTVDKASNRIFMNKRTLKISQRKRTQLLKDWLSYSL